MPSSQLWLENFAYRRKVTVTNTSGVVTVVVAAEESRAISTIEKSINIGLGHTLNIEKSVNMGVSNNVVIKSINIGVAQAQEIEVSINIGVFQYDAETLAILGVSV